MSRQLRILRSPLLSIRLATARSKNAHSSYRLPTHACYSSQAPTGTVPEKAEIVIIGGGIIGTLAAVFLANRIPGNSICVVEKDLSVS